MHREDVKVYEAWVNAECKRRGLDMAEYHEWTRLTQMRFGNEAVFRVYELGRQRGALDVQATLDAATACMEAPE